MAAKQQKKSLTRSKRTVKYEKGHKVQRLLQLNTSKGKRHRETSLSISMTCKL